MTLNTLEISNLISSYTEQLAVTNVNQAVQTGDQALLMKTLQHPRSQLPEVFEFAGPLYLEEFKAMREDKEGDLDYQEILATVRGKCLWETTAFIHQTFLVLFVCLI